MREASRGFLLVVIIQLNVSDTERDSERFLNDLFFKWHTVHPHQSTRQSAQTSPPFEISLLLFMWKLTAENHLLAEHEHISAGGIKTASGFVSHHYFSWHVYCLLYLIHLLMIVIWLEYQFLTVCSTSCNLCFCCSPPVSCLCCWTQSSCLTCPSGALLLCTPVPNHLISLLMTCCLPSCTWLANQSPSTQLFLQQFVKHASVSCPVQLTVSCLPAASLIFTLASFCSPVAEWTPV